jgi:serine/threonine protein kinase
MSSCRGYLAPEFFSGLISFKSDVYSLGVIIMEVVTGIKGYCEIEDVRKILYNPSRIKEIHSNWLYRAFHSTVFETCLVVEYKFGS